jgi:putative transposase
MWGGRPRPRIGVKIRRHRDRRGADTRVCCVETHLDALPSANLRIFPTTAHLSGMPEFRRRLPHYYSQGEWLFVTCHLHGSLPHAKYPPPGKMNSGAAFVWMDRYLDSASTGPRYLAQRPVAQIVARSLHRGVLLGHYDLAAYVVMSNHIHLLLLPKIAPSRLLQSLKGATAKEANRILGRTGETFWQAESYDRWVRDEAEWKRIVAYIEHNPVKAGLVLHAEDYEWSSASQRPGSVEMSLDAADTSVCATPLADPIRQ